VCALTLLRAPVETRDARRAIRKAVAENAWRTARRQQHKRGAQPRLALVRLQTYSRREDPPTHSQSPTPHAPDTHPSSLTLRAPAHLLVQRIQPFDFGDVAVGATPTEMRSAPHQQHAQYEHAPCCAPMLPSLLLPPQAPPYPSIVLAAAWASLCICALSSNNSRSWCHCVRRDRLRRDQIL
jgi:hypothetical protein